MTPIAKGQILKGEVLKGHLPMLILSALRHGPLHGYAIVDAIRQASGGRFAVPEGTVYPALHRLERAGLLRSAWAADGNRPRRVYRLTRHGSESLAAQLQSWRDFVEGVDGVVKGRVS